MPWMGITVASSWCRLPVEGYTSSKEGTEANGGRRYRGPEVRGRIPLDLDPKVADRRVVTVRLKRL